MMQVWSAALAANLLLLTNLEIHHRISRANAEDTEGSSHSIHAKPVGVLHEADDYPAAPFFLEYARRVHLYGVTFPSTGGLALQMIYHVVLEKVHTSNGRGN